MAGLRDRALPTLMLYSLARVSAVLGMRRQDYFGQGIRGWLTFHEKGGSGTTSRRITGPQRPSTRTSRRVGSRKRKVPLFESNGRAGAAADAPGARAAARPGDDQAT